jgi:FKBP-type peptidyl-prolyl cis-trans isomerase (trigger factor)
MATSVGNNKRKKFEILAEKRIAEAIKKLRLIGNLANKNNYSYTEEHVQQMIRVLEAEFKQLRIRFNSGRGGDDINFKFSVKTNYDANP